MKHDLAVSDKRKLVGLDREKAKKELRYTKPAVLVSKRRIGRHCDQESIRKGNNTDIQNKRAFQTANAQVNARY